MTPDLSPKVVYAEETVVDPATGAERKMWIRDPQTGELVKKVAVDEATGQPIIGDDGNPVYEPLINEATGEQEDPLGFISHLAPGLAKQLRKPDNWLSIVGLIGVLIAFGHSVLAMSGEETLAQVYREVESPKLKNFKKAAFIVFLYSLALTASISFLAVLLVPDQIRMKDYSGNFIGGLAMYVLGPPWARLLLNGFVVVVGFLILAGAVNTAIIGSNGVLNRVAEDGVLPDWFLKPHRRFGTTYRVLTLIVGLQLATIIITQGNMYALGEAYAFGVVWSFVFKALAMVVLRFKDRNPREFKVPLNVKIRGVEVPIGLMIVFLILLAAAICNAFTKEVATVGGLGFTAVFLTVFIASEHFHEKRRGEASHLHLEQFNQRAINELAPTLVGLTKPYRKLVAIRSPQNLFMLEKALFETDPETTDVVVMTAHVTPRGDAAVATIDLDQYDRGLMTAVVTRAEKAGKHVQPLIVRTNNPLFAVIQTAKELSVQELILGASNIYTADEQIGQIALYWINLHEGEPTPLTVRILSRHRDLTFDLAGGSRIPKIGERRARSAAELRAAGVGVSHVLLAHYDNSQSSDLFAAALTMLDPDVTLSVVRIPDKSRPAGASDCLQSDLDRAKQLRRDVQVWALPLGDPAQQLVELARSLDCDLIVLGMLEEPSPGEEPLVDAQAVIHAAACPVCLISTPVIPDEVDR